MIISTVLIASALVVSGALLTYYAEITGTHDVDELWTITENSTGSWFGGDAEEFDITYNTNDIAPGDTVEWQFNLTLSSEADTGKTMYFHVIDNEDNGTDCKILTESGNEASEITDQAFNPGDTKIFYFYLTTDVYTPEDDYIVTVTMEAT